MCCDGTLFHSVVLQPNDSATSLSSLGLVLKRKKGAFSFRQPCPAHQNNQCGIYENRPHRCRLFHCQQLLQVSSGTLSQTQALETIRSTREKIKLVDQLIAKITETNPNHGLTQRAATALATTPTTPLHAELTLAIDELNQTLNEQFRVPEESP
jgi:Fe-S-cluster containining protein